MMSEAFVYEWKNKTNGKKYIGYHQGDENDGYVFSSKDEELLEAIARGQMERTIVANGTTQDMITLERNMLLEADAANNPEYYNKTNGGGKDLKAHIKPSLDVLENKIKNKEYEICMVPKGDVAAYKSFQVRFNEIDPKHVRHLKQKIDDKNGDTSDFDPVDILMDFYGKGDHLLMNGNQRRQAILDSKYARYVPCQYIPKSDWKQYSNIELESLANRLNKIPEKISLAVSKDDAIKYLKSVHAEGREVNTQQNHDELTKGYGFTKRQATDIIKSTIKEIEKEDSIPAGAVWIDWAKARKAQAKSIVEQYRTNDTMAFLMSSGGPQMWRVLEASIEFPKKSKIQMVVYHPSPADERKWFKDYLPLFEKTIKLRLNVTVNFTYLQTLDHLAGLQNPENVV